MTSSRHLFVTGTDTGVGKTWIAVALLRAHVRNGRRAVGMKPVAAGLEAGETVNADVAALAAAGNVDAPLPDRNPYTFEQPVAPHVAAASAGTTIDLATIAAAFARLAARADVVIVEGAGGALVPLDARRDMLDIAVRLRLPVLLVVGLKLGCLNHALLAALAIRARGLELAGWAANAMETPMARADETVAALDARLAAPRIATVARGGTPAFPAQWLGEGEPC